jgi:hypothetical protein
VDKLIIVLDFQVCSETSKQIGYLASDEHETSKQIGDVLTYGIGTYRVGT